MMMLWGMIYSLFLLPEEINVNYWRSILVFINSNDFLIQFDCEPCLVLWDWVSALWVIPQIQVRGAGPCPLLTQHWPILLLLLLFSSLRLVTWKTQLDSATVFLYHSMSIPWYCAQEYATPIPQVSVCLSLLVILTKVIEEEKVCKLGDRGDHGLRSLVNVHRVELRLRQEKETEAWWRERRFLGRTAPMDLLWNSLI